MAEMSVELVAVERRVWSGTANSLFARTTEGELGVLPGHAPLLGQLVEDGVVTIRTTGGETVTAAVFGGFLSVTGEKVSVLAESAELADEIDASAAREQLQQVDSAGEPEDAARARARATARLKATGETV